MDAKRKNFVLNILLTIFVAIFIISVYMIFKELAVYKKGTDEYEEVAQLAITMPEELVDNPLARVVNFEELKKINSEVVGWIYIPGTIVDYPVVKGQNNDKYLNRLFSGERNKAGAIFMDYRNNLTFTDDNTLIYGHNMKNKSMFHIIKEYGKQEFYDNHKIIYYYTEDAVYELRVFSAYTVSATDPYTQVDFGSKRQERIKSFTDRSAINPAYTLLPDAKIVTLSTCSYDYDDARFVVHATAHKQYFGGH